MAIPTTCASEIVFLDPDVPHCEDLVSGVAADRQVRLLDRAGDPLAQIADVLDHCGSIDAVHIVTHGASGALHFAAGAVTQASFDTNREALARIGDALAPGAEILLWACNTARGAAGRRFLAQLAEATGAAVAAATRRVGSAERGGRWMLDRATGVIAAGIPFTATTCAHYRGALPGPSSDHVFDDTALTGEDAGPITILVLQNDIPERTEAIIAATDGGHGTVSIDYNGTGDPSDDFIVYTPNADFHGIDTFTYTATGFTLALAPYTETATVTVTVNAVADIVPDNVTVGQDSGPNALDLLANDTFEDPDRSIISIAGGSHGTVVINDNGTSLTTADDYVTYTPASGYIGLDTFTYTVFSGGVIETATVSVTVSTAVHLANDAATIAEDAGPTNIPVLANDAFGATPSIVATTDGAHGTVSINNNGTSGNTADDFVVYTPDADFNGADSFTYTVTSGGVTATGAVNVTVNAAADIVDDNVTVNHDFGANNLNLLANDTFENSSRSIAAVGAASHGTTAINNNGTAGTTLDDFVVYTPTPGYSGLDAFTYTVTSGGVTETATVNITVSGSSAVTPSASNDILSGSDSSDTIAAEGGDDLVNALGGSNLLYGNQGNDSLLGGDGNDTAYGGLDNDRLSGGAGKDLLFGNEGADTVDGGEGNNTIVGGQDFVRCGQLDHRRLGRRPDLGQRRCRHDCRRRRQQHARRRLRHGYACKRRRRRHPVRQREQRHDRRWRRRQHGVRRARRRLDTRRCRQRLDLRQRGQRHARGRQRCRPVRVRRRLRQRPDQRLRACRR